MIKLFFKKLKCMNNYKKKYTETTKLMNNRNSKASNKIHFKLVINLLKILKKNIILIQN